MELFLLRPEQKPLPYPVRSAWFMHRFLLVTAISLTLVALHLTCSLAVAQNQSESQPREIVLTEPFKIGDKVFRPDEIIIGIKDGQPVIDQNKLAEVQEAATQQVASQFGVATNGKFYDRIRAAMTGDTSGSYSVRSPQDEEHPRIVIKHLRSTAGIALPGQEELASPKLPFSEEQIRKSIDEYVAAVQAQNPAADLETKALPDCEFPKTEKVTPQFEASDYPSPEFDFLFLAKGKEPLSPQELYGEYATILIYEPGSTGAESLIAKGMSVSCLPSRYRFKDGTMYMHQGRDALRNYDRSSEGEDIGAKKSKAKKVTAKKRPGAK